MIKPIRWIVWILSGLICFLVLSLALLSFVRIPIDLTPYKGIAETIASRAINRPVHIDQTIQVTTSLRPVFTIQGLRVGNPKGFKSRDFSRMNKARLQIRILPLFALKVHVDEFSVDSLGLFLEKKQGAVNWTFGDAIPDNQQPKNKKEPGRKLDLKLRSDSLVIAKIDLRNLSVSFQNGTNDPMEFIIDQCTGSALAGKALKLNFQGKLLGEPFSTTIEAASLEEFLDHNRSWTRIQMDIAKARFSLEGDIDLATANRSLQMKAAVEGKQLNSFNQLLNLDLPPVPAYGAKCLMTLVQDRLELNKLALNISDSRLTGQMTVDAKGTKPLVDIAFTSPMIQLDDFIFDTWSPRKQEPDKTTDESPRKGMDGAAMEAAVKLFAPETLKKVDVQVRVTADQVVSGKDILGSGELHAKLEKGRITLDPVALNLPGGSMTLSMSIKPDPHKSKAWVRAKIDNFDIGVLVHRAAPDADMGGTINLDVDLETEAASLEEILANGNGHFDFSAHPKNIKAGILDLWAVNIIVAAVARSDKGQSQIECLMGRWSMKDGYLTPDAFVIDTSRMRICGTGWADFKKEAVSLRVAPIPKKPAFFSLATPVGIQGDFSDFQLGIVPGGLVGTSVKFITSPIHVPIAMLARVKLPKDGGDVCSQPLGREDRPIKPPVGCRGLYQ